MVDKNKCENCKKWDDLKRYSEKFLKQDFKWYHRINPVWIVEVRRVKHLLKAMSVVDMAYLRYDIVDSFCDFLNDISDLDIKVKKKKVNRKVKKKKVKKKRSK